MFANACRIVRQFTRPVVISRRTYDGSLSASIGTFVVLNNEGWILTAFHILDLIQNLIASKVELTVWQGKETEILEKGLPKRERTRQMQSIGHPTKDAVAETSTWWSWDRTQLVEASAIPSGDLAVGRLEPFDPTWVSTYPVLKDPGRGLDQGTSLCRMGFPFHSQKPEWDETQRAFSLQPGTVPPLFPIEGILTRMIGIGRHEAGYEISCIETSSPGLLGQSGGPIFDRQGTVWGIQSKTIHLALGFSPPVPGGEKKGQKEHQFLNLGWGVHPATIVGHLRERGIAFTLSEY